MPSETLEPAREPSEGMSGSGIVCLCLSVFGKSASVTGCACGTFGRDASDAYDWNERLVVCV